MKINDIIQEAVGKIVQGVNTTADVKPGQTEVEAKKFFGGDGKPKSLGVPGATPNQAFNMGLTESKAELYKLYRKGMKIPSGTEERKKIDARIAELRKQLKMDESETEVTEKVKGPIAVAKDLINKARHGNKPQKMALDMMHKIITKKGTDANHGIGWYADMVARQFPEGIIDVRSLVDAYQAQYMNERKMTKGERAKETRLKDKYDDSDMKQSMKDQYGDDWEEVYYATIRKRAMSESRDILEYVNAAESNEITIEDDVELVCEYSDLTEAEYQGRKVELNKPMQGDVKKFKVYVKNDKGNVVKVNFGQKGAKIKKDNPERRKSFRARHNCDNPGPKWKARYWSCRKW